MGFWDGLEKKLAAETENISELRERAAQMNIRDLCCTVSNGGAQGARCGAELKERLQTMSNSEKKELLNFCRERNYALAAKTIARSIEKG